VAPCMFGRGISSVEQITALESPLLQHKSARH
jgi:hypothetical protein